MSHDAPVTLTGILRFLTIVVTTPSAAGTLPERGPTASTPVPFEANFVRLNDPVKVAPEPDPDTGTEMPPAARAGGGVAASRTATNRAVRIAGCFMTCSF